MKLMNKLFAVLALVAVSNMAFGYRINFKNKTKNSVGMKITLDSEFLPKGQTVENRIAPDEVVGFNIPETSPLYLGSVRIGGKEVYKDSNVSMGTGESARHDANFDITGTIGDFKLSFASE
jgi:hypothetical protein